MAVKIISKQFDAGTGVEHITLQDGLGRKHVVSVHMNTEKCPTCSRPMATLNVPDAKKVHAAVNTRISEMEAEETQLRNYAIARGYGGYEK